jgi:hypothetical protein
MSTGEIAAKGRRAGQSPWVERLGRAGLVAKGVIYAVVGILALIAYALYCFVQARYRDV